MKAVVTGTVALPKAECDLSKIRKDTDVKVFNIASGESYTVSQHERGGIYIHVPRDYGIRYARRNHIPLTLRTSSGKEAFTDVQPIKLYDYQKPWVKDICFNFDKHTDVIAQAATGKGKTVMALEVARRLRRTTLVIVDQEFLKEQWIKTAKDILGLPEERIGILQGEVCDYDDKDLVIGMIQTLYAKEYASHVYDAFGLVILDESHTVGAEQFSNVLWSFNARYRLAVSATPDRSDSLQKVLELHLGKVRVELKDEHLASTVRYITYDGVISWYANISPKTGRYLQELSQDQVRNHLIVRAVKKLYDKGRDILVISDRIAHLETLMVMAEDAGIPSEDMGQVTRYRNTWRYAKDKTPKRKPAGLEPGAEYTPIKLQLVAKKVNKETIEEQKSRKIIFATYSMFQKGVDVPRLSAGIDATPRAKATQVHGRILRPKKGKPTPIWVTIRDVMSYRAEHQFVNRLSDYRKSNAEIYQWHLDRGVKKVDHKKLERKVKERVQVLKSAKIITGLDGNNTLMIQNTEKQQSKEAVKTTSRRRGRRRRA